MHIWPQFRTAAITAMAFAATAGTPAHAPIHGRVDATRLRAAAREPEQWLTTGRDSSGTYYSPLTLINQKNVARLGFAWEFKFGTQHGLEATPLVIDGVMYTSGNWGVVYALNAATGVLRWSFDPQANAQVARFEEVDVVNRGVAVWQGRVYVVAPDCRLIALDAASGQQLWETNTLADRSEPYVCSGAPQLAGSVIVVGNAGADSSPGGLRGYISAFDPATGAFRWRFYTVPALHDRTPTPELTAAAATWDPQRDPSFGGGGNVWHGMAYDPDLNLLYVGTGNAAPYGAPRAAHGHGTDNLYAASIIALHAGSGRIKWYFQTTPGDRWDYDAANTMILADLSIGGHKRAALLQANKNGYFYVLDRVTGKPLRAKAFAYTSWSTGLDREFRPLVSADADYHSAPRLIYPGMQGAHSWSPMSFSPRTGFVYIPVIDAPNILVDLTRNPGASISFIDEATSGVGFAVPDRDYDPAFWRPVYGELPRAPATNPKTGKPLVRGVLKAWDPIAQRVAWEQETSNGYLLLDGGTLATAGDVVFAGREDGRFVAYDARSGVVLRMLDTGTPIMAAPMSYAIDGTQYVAVMAAHGGAYMGSFAGTAAMKYLNEGRIIVFKLDGAGAVPKPPLRTVTAYRQPPVQAGSPAQIKAGLDLFSIWCARCHALGIPGVTPDLSRLNNGIENRVVFQAIVLKGAFLSRGMARFDNVLSPDDADALHAYLVDQAWQAYQRQGTDGSAPAP